MVVLQRGDVVIAKSQDRLSVDLLAIYIKHTFRLVIYTTVCIKNYNLGVNLVDIVVARVVKVVAQRRGQHYQQVSAGEFTPQIRQPDQPVHLQGRTADSVGATPQPFTHKLICSMFAPSG